MRRRFRSIRARSMASRPDGDGPLLDLSPRAMRIAGWVVAFGLIAGIAVVVGLLGGDADSGPLGASPSASGGTSATTIVFGTSIDEATGAVAESARTDRFTAGETFAYSVELTGTTPDPVFVEVRRTGGGAAEIVQAAVDGRQPLEYAPALAFDVPADDLFEVFGPGEYLMLIYADPEAEPLAEGTFHLVGPAESPPPNASASPS
jgi:hypothetical protein